MSVSAVEHRIVIDKQKGTASIIATNTATGARTTITIFANSRSNNRNLNRVFDGADKITVTTSDGSKPQVDAGLVARFLKAINNKSAADASDITSIEASGVLFDPSQYTSNGVGRTISKANDLCIAAEQSANRGNNPFAPGAATPPATTPPTTPPATTPPTPPAPSTVPPTGGTAIPSGTNTSTPVATNPNSNRLQMLNALRTEYYDIQNQISALQMMQSTQLGLSNYMSSTFNNPFMPMMQNAFTFNGFPDVAFNMGVSNNNLRNAFMIGSGGITPEQAQTIVQQRLANLQAKLSELGLTMNDLLYNFNNIAYTVPNTWLTNPYSSTPTPTTTTPLGGAGVTNPPAGMGGPNPSGGMGRTSVTIETTEPDAPDEPNGDNDNGENNGLTDEEQEAFYQAVTNNSEYLRILGITSRDTLVTKINRVFENGKEEQMAALSASIEKVNELQEELGKAETAQERGRLRREIKEELRKIKDILSNRQRPAGGSSDAGGTNGTGNAGGAGDAGNHELETDMTTAEVTAILTKLGMGDQLALVTAFLQYAPDDKRNELMKLLQEASELEESDSITSTTLINKKKEIENFLNANKAHARNTRVEDHEAGASAGKEEAQTLFDAIDGCGTDEETVSSVINGLTMHSVLSIYEEYIKVSGNTSKENLCQALFGDMDQADEEELKGHYTTLYNRLKEYAEYYGIPIGPKFTETETAIKRSRNGNSDAAMENARDKLKDLFEHVIAERDRRGLNRAQLSIE